MKVHRLHGQQNRELHLQAAFGAVGAQLELAAPSNHVFQYLFQSELVLAGPVRDELADLCAVTAEKAGGELVALMAGIIGEEPAQIAVVDVGVADQIAPTLVRVVLAKAQAESAQ